MITRRLTALLASVGTALPLVMMSPAVHAGEYPQHISVGGQAEATQRIKVGINKSVIVDLPRAARDVLVSNPEVADAVIRSQQRTFLIGKAAGQTNVFFFDIEGRQILALEVEVVHDVAVLKQALRRLLPQSDIEVSGIGESIVLSGLASNASEADQAVKLTRKFINDDQENRVVNMIGIAGKEQVALKVTVAEMERTTLKQLGVDLNAALELTSSTLLTASTLNPFTITGTVPDSFGILNSSESGGTCLLAGSGNCVAGIVQALERNGLLRTLAEPTLTSISGETASFLAGGEYPVPVGRDRDGNVSLEFKPFGVKLAFTPLVLSENRISLKIGTEVSELSNENALVLSGFTIPGLKVRRTDSTIELPSGGSLILAGLIKESSKQELNGFPGLKNLPVLGALFRSREFQNSETELVVIATPYIVNPTSRDQLAQPDEGFAQPSDHEATLLGRLNAVYGMRNGQPLSGSYVGDVGFIVK